MRRKFFAEANGSLYEVAAAVDVAGLIGAMRETERVSAEAVARCPETALATWALCREHFEVTGLLAKAVAGEPIVFEPP